MGLIFLEFRNMQKNPNYKNVLLSLIDEDTLAYNNIIDSRRLPKKSKKDQIFRVENIIISLVFFIYIKLN